MNTRSVCIGFNSTKDLSFVNEKNLTMIQVGDLTILDDVDIYVQRLSLQLKTIDRHNARKVLLLPLFAPDGNNNVVTRIIEAAYEAGIDEIVANSLGQINTVRKLYPGILLTASDYVCCYCVSDALVLQDFGVARVRLSPEMSYPQIAALASNAPIDLQVIVYGCLTLGVLQEFSRSELRDERDVPFSICATRGGKALFRINGSEIVAEHCINLLDNISDFERIGIPSFFIDARFLDDNEIALVCDSFMKSLLETTRISKNIAEKLTIPNTEKLRPERSFCNGWFHGNPGIGDFR